MKRLFFCLDCNYYDTYSGFECPKCGSRNIEIDDEPDLEGRDYPEKDETNQDPEGDL